MIPIQLDFPVADFSDSFAVWIQPVDTTVWCLSTSAIFRSVGRAVWIMSKSLKRNERGSAMFDIYRGKSQHSGNDVTSAKPGNVAGIFICC